jgi:hypothetical protein
MAFANPLGSTGPLNEIAANEDMTGSSNDQAPEVDPFKKTSRALGAMATKPKKKRTAQQEDISAGIHVFFHKDTDVNGRDKPGHDAGC